MIKFIYHIILYILLMKNNDGDEIQYEMNGGASVD